jgi:hypothetical protein
MSVRSVVGCVLVCAMLVQTTLAVTFDVHAATKRCVQEDVHKDILVVGEYEISEDSEQRVDLEVG